MKGEDSYNFEKAKHGNTVVKITGATAVMVKY